MAIRTAMDWVLQQAKARQVVVSGFHSPLEQSALTVLLQARSPVVAVLARPVSSAKLPPAWAEPLAQGRMAVVSRVSTNGTYLSGFGLNSTGAMARSRPARPMETTCLERFCSPDPEYFRLSKCHSC